MDNSPDLQLLMNQLSNSFEKTTTGFRTFVLKSMPDIEVPQVVKPKKPWERLNKTAYKSKKG